MSTLGRTVSIGALAAAVAGCVFTGEMDWRSAGALDGRFGENGVTFDPAQALSRSVGVLPDGRILVLDTLGYHGDGGDVRLRRLLQDGRPDPTFGVEGRVVIDLGASEFARALGVQESGRILALIWSQDTPAGEDPIRPGRGLVLVARTSDGDVDGTFANGGMLELPGADQRDLDPAGPSPLRILSSTGEILVAYGVPTADAQFVIRRYSANGIVDPSFGSQGEIRHAFSSKWALPAGIELAPEGLLVPGSFYDGNVVYRPTILRTGAESGTGAPVETLDIETGGPVDCILLATAMDDRGRLLALAEGWSGDTPATYLVRWNEGGAIDGAFLAGGTEAIPAHWARALRTGDDGMIYVGGLFVREGDRAVAGVLRFRDDGRMDETFGRGGIASLGIEGEVYDLAFDADGNVLAAGWGLTLEGEPNNHAFVARIWR